MLVTVIGLRPRHIQSGDNRSQVDASDL